MRPLVVTPGEPAGIGPDVLLQTIAEGYPTLLVAVASKHLLLERNIQLGLHVELVTVTENDFTSLAPKANTLYVLDIALNTPCEPGVLNSVNGHYVLSTLDKAIELVTNGTASAIVTGPVHKGVINDAGIAFSGHTEYLRDKSGIEEVVMMLATEGLRVALVTTHLPLKDVANAVTKEKLQRVTRILNASLITDFDCNNPNILVCGLNPHAGEGGHLGMEEIDTIIPALDSLRTEGINTIGPLPADTLFQPHYLKDADAVLAMYHDQGLPVLKFKGFSNAVNITLGLPFIRTSVDHGTALDLAGSGKADTGSLKVAIQTAQFMAAARDKHHA